METKLRWAERYPELGTGPLDAITPFSKPQYELEQDKVFRKAWLCVGREEELPSPGNYKVKKIDVAKTSVILFKGRNGKISAFHNVCSHRANKIIPERGEEIFGRNPAATMACSFHGWVYNAKGDLINVPDEHKFCFEKEGNGLTKINVDTWMGFIFINFDENPAETLAENMAEVKKHFCDYPFHEMTYRFTYSTVLNANWKIAMDAFSEVYHLGYLHSRTLPGSFGGGLESFKVLGDHRTFALHLDLENAKFTPLQEVSNSFATVSLMVAKEGTLLPPTFNPDRRAHYGFELSPIFPNFIIHMADGLWFTHQFWPMGHDKVLWEGKYYVREPKTYSQLWAAHHAQTVTRNVWLEDGGTIELTQGGIDSGAKKHLFLSDDEITIRHHHHVINKYVNA